MEMTYNAILVLKHVLMHTGEMEIGAGGKEVPSKRRLSVDDSIKRSNFMSAVEGVCKSVQEQTKELAKAHQQLVQEERENVEKNDPRGKEENKKQYRARINAILDADESLQKSAKETRDKVAELFKSKYTVNIDEATKDACKYFFYDYADSRGFSPQDDETVAEIDKLLK